jgi:hypothetical protein
MNRTFESSSLRTEARPYDSLSGQQGVSQRRTAEVFQDAAHFRAMSANVASVGTGPALGTLTNTPPRGLWSDPAAALVARLARDEGV